MNRAMFSGVAGLKTHQTKMDVIGNNIANVNTFGYKSQRAVFSDIYYQTIRSASAGTTSRGGRNPSSVGYGSSLAAVQAQMTQSSMQNTGFGLDVAITGEGFLQVMDPDGNIFYTKAGMLDYDANGYLTDINGNFVLGATSTDGKPGEQKIRLDNVGSVESKKPTITESINGTDYTITASNATKYGNVNISINSSEDLPAGLKAKAVISNSGSITVQLNAYEKFASMTELNDVVNSAIKEANGGKEHPAGRFTITATENKFGVDAINGTYTGGLQAENAKIEPVDGGKFFAGKLEIGSFTPEPGTTMLTDTTNGSVKFDVAKVGGTGTPPTPTTYTIKATVGGIEYKLEGVTENTKYPLELASANGGTITLKEKKGVDKLKDADWETISKYTGTEQTSNVKAPKYFLGGAMMKVSDQFPYSGDISFAVTAADATGAYKLAITVKDPKGDKVYYMGGDATNPTAITPGTSVTFTTDKTKPGAADDGSITMKFPSLAEMKANFGVTAVDGNMITNSAKLTTELKAVAAKPAQNMPLTGAQIAGVNFGVLSGTMVGSGVEDGFFGGGMLFKKTSSDFIGSGTIKDAADFGATYHAAANGEKAFWTVSMNIGGNTYEADISEGTVANTVLLKNTNGKDYIEMTNPGFKKLTDHYETGGQTVADGKTMTATTGGTNITITPAEPSRDLGFGPVSFTLTGGTEGGVISLDQLSSIAIGADGSVSVSHSEKGTVNVGKISLATFANPSGLSAEGSNYYAMTVNSGEPKLCNPGSDGSGGLKSNSLEMSNVDLSAEFADMITTQRGFQANSRIITVADTMLEELINLKR